MANNYTQFSAELTGIAPEEATWLQDQLDTMIAVDEYGNECVIAKDGEPPEIRRYFGPKIMRGCVAYDDYLGLQYKIEPVSDGTFSLWLYAEENGDPYLAAYAVQQFLKKFRPDGYWGLTWASTCSKMRIDEFDGGGVFVTAKDIKFQAGWSYVADEIAKFKKGKKNEQE